MGAIRQLADDYFRELCRLDPCLATNTGIERADHLLTDMSPDGHAARAALVARTLDRLNRTVADGQDDERCAALLRDRLGVAAARFDAGEHLRDLACMGTHLETMLESFEALTPAPGASGEWESLIERVAALPAYLASFRESVDSGRSRRLVAPARQVEAVADIMRDWATTGPTGYFGGRLRSAPSSMTEAARRATGKANAALADFEAYLRRDYLPASAGVPDAVGPERYALGVSEHLGGSIDIEETSEWAWAELQRIEDEMRIEADAIVPGGTPEAAFAWLDEHGPAAHGEDELRQWLQDLMDSTIAEFQGTHFDLAPEVRVVEAMIAPPGTGAAQYYTQPTVGFERPGRTWYPTMGKERFPYWNEVSTCYHEGVPGHHLQLAQWVLRSRELSVFQGVVYVSGNIEGWALYGERLMDELGFFSADRAPHSLGSRLGYLVAQQLRATRVIVDIGMHCETRIPTGQPFHPGERWTAQLGREFLYLHAGKDPDFIESEWLRYLGWPGQAICYKLGERVWLDGRAEAMRRQGSAFDLKRWHGNALNLGSLGLDALAADLPNC